ARAEAILQHERGDADRLKPLSHWRSFVIGKMAVATAWTNDNRRASRFLFQRQESCQGRNVEGVMADCARRAVGPENDWCLGHFIDVRERCRSRLRIPIISSTQDS